MEYWWNYPNSRKQEYSEKSCHTANFHTTNFACRGPRSNTGLPVWGRGDNHQNHHMVLGFVVCPIQLSWLAYKHESTRRHISSSRVTSTLYTRSCPCRASEVCLTAAEIPRRRYARKWRDCGKSTHTHTHTCVCMYIYIYIYNRICQGCTVYSLIYIYIYIYIYIERERERERE